MVFQFFWSFLSYMYTYQIEKPLEEVYYKGPPIFGGWAGLEMHKVCEAMTKPGTADLFVKNPEDCLAITNKSFHAAIVGLLFMVRVAVWVVVFYCLFRCWKSCLRGTRVCLRLSCRLCLHRFLPHSQHHRPRAIQQHHHPITPEREDQQRITDESPGDKNEKKRRRHSSPVNELITLLALASSTYSPPEGRGRRRSWSQGTSPSKIIADILLPDSPEQTKNHHRHASRSLSPRIRR